VGAAARAIGPFSGTAKGASMDLRIDIVSDVV